MGEPTKEEIIEVLKEMVYQFAGQSYWNSNPAYDTMGLSSLESAFEILGWYNPYPCPENACQIDGCNEWSICNTPTSLGYKRVCGKHFREINIENNSTTSRICCK